MTVSNYFFIKVTDKSSINLAWRIAVSLHTDHDTGELDEETVAAEET